ncbi:MAG: 2-oxo acid dehydrogenase subunit E2, partial [Pseudomonadota bacterium]|nr:2-oxo acid dehydrogenase subunit E2 [Pseudomonadota bacterium]
MSIEIKVPMLPESVADATLLVWHKQAGEFVSRDENLVDVETDKVVLEVPAPADGVLSEIRRPAGETVLADEVIALFEPGEAPAGNQPAADEAESGEAGSTSGMGPAVRSLLTEHGLEAGRVKGSGKGGRILKEDVLAHIAQQQEAPRGLPVDETPAATAEPAPSAAPPPAAGERIESREPMSRLRRTIAARLVQAQQNAAMLTTFNEVNMQPVMSLRKKYQEAFEKKHGVRLGFMSFFVRASVAALQRYPLVNAHIDGTDIVQHNY